MLHWKERIIQNGRDCEAVVETSEKEMVHCIMQPNKVSFCLLLWGLLLLGFFLLLKEAVVDSKEEPHSVSPLTFPPPLVGSSFSLFFPPSSFFFLSPSILTYFTLGVLFSLSISPPFSLSRYAFREKSYLSRLLVVGVVASPKEKKERIKSWAN